MRDGASFKNIKIGDNVTFGGKTYIRLRKEGSIEIGNGCSLGTEVWLVSANVGKLTLGQKVIVGSYCILNGGHGIEIGDSSWIAGFVYLNSSDHLINKNALIQDQGYEGAPIKIGKDNWIGGHSFINKGVSTGMGVVVGAGTIVTKDFPDYAIVVGNPGKIIKYRK